MSGKKISRETQTRQEYVSELDAFKNGRFAAFHKAVDGTDADAVAAFYDPNATVVHRDVKVVYGRPGVKQLTEEFLEKFGQGTNNVSGSWMLKFAVYRQKTGQRSQLHCHRAGLRSDVQGRKFYHGRLPAGLAQGQRRVPRSSR